MAHESLECGEKTPLRFCCHQEYGILTHDNDYGYKGRIKPCGPNEQGAELHCGYDKWNRFGGDLGLCSFSRDEITVDKKTGEKIIIHKNNGCRCLDFCPAP